MFTLRRFSFFPHSGALREMTAKPSPIVPVEKLGVSSGTL